MAVPPPSYMTMAKTELRSAMRRARRAFVASSPPPIQPPAPYRERLAKARCVAGYVPVGSEADPALLIAEARRRGCAIALPWVEAPDRPMRFLLWEADVPLETGLHGLRQPPADAPICLPDIVLVPLVAFDHRCHRLGQGAGYYDRALADLPDAWRLGVAWSVQQAASVPVDRWDVPLHGVVTECEYFERPSA